MLAADVLTVLELLGSADVSVWLDGGWGVDALLGRQSRVHEDLDLVIESRYYEEVRHVLEPLGFELAEDHLPTRACGARLIGGRSTCT